MATNKDKIQKQIEALEARIEKIFNEDQGFISYYKCYMSCHVTY